MKKKYGTRIKTVKNIRLLDGKLKQLESIAQQLKKDKDVTTNGINQLKSDLNAAIDKIKVTKHFGPKFVFCDKLDKKCILTRQYTGCFIKSGQQPYLGKY